MLGRGRRSSREHPQGRHSEGQLRTRSYNDKAGEKRYVTEVVAKSVVVDAQDRPSGEDDIPYPWRPKGRTASMDAPERSEDDIPF